jgi:oligopeptide transport system permease protein
MKTILKGLAPRIIYMVLTLFIIITLTFFLINSLPGTPYKNQEKLSDTQIEILNEKYGFDKPLGVRYLTYLKNVLHGDFGISLQFSDQQVSRLIGSRIGPSIQIGLQAVIFGTVVGVLLGLIAAMKQNTWLDTLCSFLAIIGRSVPNFVVAVVLQTIFAITLSLLPIGLWNQGFRSSILPSLALSIGPMADAARFIRTEMIEVLNSDYIELARAKGMSELQVAFRHGLRNAVIPLITTLGPQVVALMTGSMVVENIFSIPGLGEQFTKSILANDYYTIMAITILYSALLVTVLFLTDILYQIVDPRIRLKGDNS